MLSPIATMTSFAVRGEDVRSKTLWQAMMIQVKTDEPSFLITKYPSWFSIAIFTD